MTIKPTRKTDSANRPTMEMLAEIAGVSKITVSRALRGSDLVRPELREKIIAIARDAGYRMNVAARALRTRRSQTIAFVIEKLIAGDRPISDPLLLAMMGGLLETLTPEGQAILITTSDHFLDSPAIDADGIVMIGQGPGGERARQIAACGLPMVVWGAPLAGVVVIGSNNRQGGELAARHLVETGRRRLLFLGNSDHPEVAARLEGVRDVLSTTPAALAGRISCEFSRATGASAIDQALRDGIAFDAVIAASDFIAAGACDALLKHGLRVPEDVAITGFDDIAVAANNRPSLTSIRQDWASAGRLLGEAIMALVAGEADFQAPGLLPVELVVRDSSAPAA